MGFLWLLGCEKHNCTTGNPIHSRFFWRRYCFKKELIKAKRSKMPLSIVLLDLDELKKINDRYGHFSGGDEALKALANVLTELCRAEDTVSRYGGDEFLVILYETSAKIAFRRALEWRKQLSEIIIEVDGSKFVITLSAGIAFFSKNGLSTEEIFSNADKALYCAKEHGRDRVIIYDADEEKMLIKSEQLNELYDAI